MSSPSFTLEQARSLLPQLKGWMGQARELKRRADLKIARWRDQVEGNGPVERALARGQVEFLLAEVRRRVEAVHSLGCLVKDIDRGLVDFPGWIPAQGEVYLCWRLGEETISHWHHQTEGFLDRKPLDSSRFFLRRFS